MDRNIKDMDNTKVGWWEFWNSKVGLFILSGIFLTLIPFGYTNIQEYLSSQKEKEIVRIRISSEIAHRLKTIQIIENRVRPYQVKDIRLATFGFREVLKPEYHNVREIFSEFKEQTLTSLIVQLNNVTTDKKKKTINIELKNASNLIKYYIDQLITNPQNRTRIDLSNENWTWEYTFRPNEKENLKENLIKPIQRWLDAWD